MDNQPILKYTADREIKCVFFSLIIRVDALREKYPGGFTAFAEKYHAICNRHLAVMCAMAMPDLDKPCTDMRETGLEANDFSIRA